MPSRFWEANAGRAFVGRLESGSDLVEEIERFCAEREVHAAWVSVVGAVRHAAYAYYDQAERRYLDLASDEHHEIAGFVGNISIRDGRPFLHAHASFGDRHGGTVTGHLLRGCRVWAAEVTIREMTGVDLVRTPDEVTGLALW
ncbi:MAG: PPC domain-containing DNA-binding protein [Candidatus Limnocylindria bacterium]